MCMHVKWIILWYCCYLDSVAGPQCKSVMAVHCQLLNTENGSLQRNCSLSEDYLQIPNAAIGISHFM